MAAELKHRGKTSAEPNQPEKQGNEMTEIKASLQTGLIPVPEKRLVPEQRRLWFVNVTQWSAVTGAAFASAFFLIGIQLINKGCYLSGF